MRHCLNAVGLVIVCTGPLGVLPSISPFQHSRMRVGEESCRFGAPLRVWCLQSPCAPCLINYHHTWWFISAAMICLVLTGCHRPTPVKEMKNEPVSSRVCLTSKLEILTYLYPEVVSSAGQRLRQWRGGQGRQNTITGGQTYDLSEGSAPSTVRGCKTTADTLNPLSLCVLIRPTLMTLWGIKLVIQLDNLWSHKMRAACSTFDFSWKNISKHIQYVTCKIHVVFKSDQLLPCSSIPSHMRQ